jgi:elongation of very long chain fatty acids protein 6
MTVLAFTWHAFATRSAPALWFVAMNYGVHAIMYTYYFLTALGRKDIPWAGAVTSLQIAQMAVGVGVCAAAAWYRATDPDGCDVDAGNLAAAAAMYASYFVLFAAFAVEKYWFPPPPPAALAAKLAPAAPAQAAVKPAGEPPAAAADVADPVSSPRSPQAGRSPRSGSVRRRA